MSRRCPQQRATPARRHEHDVIPCRLAKPYNVGSVRSPEGMAKDRHYAGFPMRTLPRAIALPEPAHGMRDPGGLAPGDEIRLACPFRRSVRGDGSRWRVFGRRQPSTVAVERATRRADDHGCLMAASCRQVQRSKYIHLGISLRLGNGARDARLCGEVEDRRGSGPFDDCIEGLAIGGIDDLEGGFDRDPIRLACREVVDDDNMPSVRKQRIDDVRADKSRLLR